jgi:hypothetical protein
MKNDKKKNILKRDSSDLRAKIAQMNEKLRLQQEKEIREQAELEEFYRNEEAKKESLQSMKFFEIQENAEDTENENIDDIDGIDDIDDIDITTERPDIEGEQSSEQDFQADDDANYDNYADLEKPEFNQEYNDAEELDESPLKRLSTFAASHKYLLCLLPVIFLVVFFATFSTSYSGTLKKNNFTYLGKIENAVPNGSGTITYSNGDTYKGNFSDGKFSGQGTFTSKDGKWTYSGNFTNGLPNGKGSLTTADGQKHDETFKNGVLAR